jgi:hypothetical protein
MACASCGEQVDRLRSANNARLTFRLRRLLSLGPLSSESGSVSFGHTRCRHQSYADDGLDCRAVTSLFMAEVALELTLGTTAAGGGRSAALAAVTLPTRLRLIAMRDAPAGSGRAVTGLAALARFAPRPLVLDLSDQVSAHLREGMIKVALVGGGHEVSPSR